MGLDHAGKPGTRLQRLSCMEAQSSAPSPRTRFMFDESSMEGIVTLGFPSVSLDES